MQHSTFEETTVGIPRTVRIRGEDLPSNLENFAEQTSEELPTDQGELPTTRKLRRQPIPERLEDFALDDTEQRSATEQQSDHYNQYAQLPTASTTTNGPPTLATGVGPPLQLQEENGVFICGNLRIS